MSTENQLKVRVLGTGCSPTYMEYWPRKLDVTEMTRTLRHPLATCLTLKVTIYSPHSGIHQPALLNFLPSLIHDLRKLDFGYRMRFLRDRGGTVVAESSAAP